MIESTVQTVINIIAGAVISYLFALYRAKKKENNALKAGLQACSVTELSRRTTITATIRSGFPFTL